MDGLLVTGSNKKSRVTMIRSDIPGRIVNIGGTASSRWTICSPVLVTLSWPPRRNARVKASSLADRFFTSCGWGPRGAMGTNGITARR